MDANPRFAYRHIDTHFLLFFTLKTQGHTRNFKSYRHEIMHSFGKVGRHNNGIFSCLS